MRVVVSSLIVLSMLLPGVASGQNCVEPPFTERYEFAGSLTDVGSGVDCRLEARLSGAPNGAATVHTVRRDASEPLVMNFRVDLSALAGQNAIQQVSLASVVSNTVVGEGANATTDLFRVNAAGNLSGTSKALHISAACASCDGNTRSASTPLMSAQPFVRVELDIGATSDGEVRVWVDRDASEPPTLVLADLDNLAWAGADRLSVGLSIPSPAFLAAFADVAVSFDRIGIGDSQWFYAGFEPEGVACDGPPLFANTMLSGSTCGGGNLSPTLASGSTSARSPERVYRFSLAEERTWTFYTDSAIPGMSAFICRDFCGPAAHCMGAASGSAPLPVALPAGDYRAIVKQSGGAGQCGDFSLTVDGPLD